MLVYTSVTKSYIPKARVLAASVKKFHSDWTFVLLLSDDLPDNFDLEAEPFDEVLKITDLDIPDLQSWIFRHSVVELCTAVKGRAASILARRDDVDKVVYLDPDTRVFNSLKPLEDLLDSNQVLLTPHLLDAEVEYDAIVDNEISVLKHGLYNLGFMAANSDGQGLEFMDWWASRLMQFCRDDIPGGLFTDQRWCDLAPIFFDKTLVLRDRGYNVATWNLAHRKLSLDSTGDILAGSDLLRFYHFTGYDSGDGDGMLKKYAADQKIAAELWAEYAIVLEQAGGADPLLKSWIYQNYESGNSIAKEARKIYGSRADLIEAFPDPFSKIEPCFESWYVAEVERGNI
jgi:hypothetical protein